MKTSEFRFNGDWEFDIEFPEFNGFQNRKGQFSSHEVNESTDAVLKIEFEDELSDNPDPTKEQFDTLHYIFDNAKRILDAICTKVLAEMQEIIINYDLQSEKEYQNLNSEKLKDILDLWCIRILMVSKDGSSYFDVSGGCSWDEEHGLNFLFHKDRVISFGGIEGNSYWEAVKDNGTYDEVKNQKRERKLPVRYLPHPKYYKLKPYQKSENEYYETKLISGGFNDVFIAGVESGEISVNGKYVNQNKSYLESACWFNNNTIVEYLISKKAEVRYALHQCVVYNDNQIAMNLLLNNGADINSPYGNGNTVIYELVNSIGSSFNSIEYYKSINKELPDDFYDRFNKLKDRIKHLIKLGADPLIRNNYGFNCFDVMRNSKEECRNDLHNFLNDCMKKN